MERAEGRVLRGHQPAPAPRRHEEHFRRKLAGLSDLGDELAEVRIDRRAGLGSGVAKRGDVGDVQDAEQLGLSASAAGAVEQLGLERCVVCLRHVGEEHLVERRAERRQLEQLHGDVGLARDRDDLGELRRRGDILPRVGRVVVALPVHTGPDRHDRHADGLAVWWEWEVLGEIRKHPAGAWRGGELVDDPQRRCQLATLAGDEARVDPVLEVAVVGCLPGLSPSLGAYLIHL